MQAERKSEKMGTDPVWRLLLSFSGPAIISMTVAASYNLVDAIFLGRLGAEALAAATVAFPMTLAFTAVAAGTGIGAASLVSRRLGAKDNEGADNVAGVTISLTVIISALMMLICLPNLETLARLLGADNTVMPLAIDYMSILVNFILISFFPHIMASIIRAEGRPILPSITLIISSLANIALDPIFIFGLGPIPALGVAGAAAATIIARAIGVVIFVLYFITGRSSYRTRLVYFLPDLKIILEIYRVGISSIIRSAATFMVIGVANRVAGSFGVLPLALIGVFLRLFRFALMPCLGIGQGMLPIIGYNYGAKKKERIGEVVFKAALSGLSWTGLVWIIIMLFPSQVISIFNSIPEFIEAGVKPLRIYSLLFLFIGIQLIPAFFFQAIGKGLPATVISNSRQVILLLPLLIFLPKILGIAGLWVAFPISDTLALLFSALWMVMELRKQEIPILFSAKRNTIRKAD